MRRRVLTLGRRSVGLRGQFTETYWYCPAVKVIARDEVKLVAGDGETTRTTVELARYTPARQKGAPQ